MSRLPLKKRQKVSEHVVRLACTYLSPLFHSSRRSTHANQGFVEEIKLDDDDDDDDDVSSTRTHSTIFSGTDSGSQIERILGRRVLPGTPEAEELMHRSRLAIVEQVYRVLL